MDYKLWQLDDNVSLSENIQRVVDLYKNKHGDPPTILETSLVNIPLPDDMNIVIRSINIPKNILLVGRLGEKENDPK